MKKKNEKEGILLESGTNEIEIMKFRVLGEFYGINVAKVKEIMMTEKIKPMPHSHPSVEAERAADYRNQPGELPDRRYTGAGSKRSVHHHTF